VLGGAQSIFTCAFDEAFQIPTETSAEIALRTQQIVAYESGIARTVDPLGGSYYVEWLTDRMEAEIVDIMGGIDDYGGTIKAIEDGYLQSRLARRALERKRDIDRGERVVVGENYYRREDEQEALGEVFRVDQAAVDKVVERYHQVRASRDAARVAACLERLEREARDGSTNLMPCLVDCCLAYVSVGEMVGTLKGVWGEFQEPVGL